MSRISPDEGAKSRILMDCSGTLGGLANGEWTGIQRVVSSLIRRRGAIGEASGAECVPVKLIAGRILRLSAAESRLLEYPPAAGGKPGGLRPGRSIKGIKSRLVLRLRRWPAVHDPAYWAWRRLVAVVNALRYLKAWVSVQLAGPHRIRSGRRDVLVVADSFWGGDRMSAALRRIRAGRTPVVLVIYDLIPIVHPELCDAALRRRIREELPGVLRSATMVLCDSDAVAKDVRAYIGRELPELRAVPVLTWYIGSDFESSAAPGEGMRIGDAVRQAAEGTRSFLVVGTIDARKGQEDVLDAFEEQWEKGASHRLILVGQVPWNMVELGRRIAGHPRLGRELVHFPYVSEAELRYLYGTCRALIFASRAEGFGLPLVEAMQSGLRVMASDIPVFREIGKDYPIYFRPRSPGWLEAAIEELARREASGEPVIARPWRDWDAAAAELGRLAVSTLGERRP